VAGQLGDWSGKNSRGKIFTKKIWVQELTKSIHIHLFIQFIPK